MLAVLALAPAYVLPARPAAGAPTVRMVESWYDSGKRLDGSTAAAAPAAGGAVTRQILSKKGEVTTVVEGAKKSLPLGVKDESQVNPLTGKVLGVALALAVGTPFISAALNGGTAPSPKSLGLDMPAFEIKMTEDDKARVAAAKARNAADSEAMMKVCTATRPAARAIRSCSRAAAPPSAGAAKGAGVRMSAALAAAPPRSRTP